MFPHSDWKLPGSRQKLQCPSECQGDFLTLTSARSFSCTLPRSNYTLKCFLIKLLNMSSQFGPSLSSLLGCKNSNVGIISKCHTLNNNTKGAFKKK